MGFERWGCWRKSDRVLCQDPDHQRADIAQNCSEYHPSDGSLWGFIFSLFPAAEASPAYFEVAGNDVESRYGSRSTQFVVGDFVAIAPALSDADVVTLDRVVCCYPDAEDLLHGAAQRARRLLAFTYPRNRWYVRVFIALENFWRRLRGNPFRAFLHPPERMHAVLEIAGFVHAGRKGTAFWMVDLYHREVARDSPQYWEAKLII
jgi:hypothetical protein